MATIVYNFRRFYSNKKYTRIALKLPNREEIYVKRLCYIYVVAAKAEPGSEDPQNSQHNPITWPGATLEIDIVELLAFMDYKFDRNTYPPGFSSWEDYFADWTLYTASANELDDDIQDYEIEVHNPIPADGRKFIVTESEMPLGLFIITAPLEINTAIEEELQTLGTGDLQVAHQIIEQRDESPFESLEDFRKRFPDVDGNITVHPPKDVLSIF